MSSWLVVSNFDFSDLNYSYRDVILSYDFLDSSILVWSSWIFDIFWVLDII